MISVLLQFGLKYVAPIWPYIVLSVGLMAAVAWIWGDGYFSGKANVEREIERSKLEALENRNEVDKDIDRLTPDAVLDRLHHDAIPN